MKLKFCIFLLTLSVFSAKAQQIFYDVSFDNIVHHELNITVTVKDAPQSNLQFRMSKSSPGRYATHEFAKNVYYVSAQSKTGSVDIKRIDSDIYEVPGKYDEVKVKYTLYGNYADGTYVGIDDETVHLNMPASFMWVRGLENAPITIQFHIPDYKKWQIATQLFPTNSPSTFTAPDLQYFLDSPVKIGQLQFREWSLINKDGSSTHFKLALEADAKENEVDQLANSLKRITAESKSIFGEFPRYDNGSYTFITSVNPWVKGDGMEHRNSTMITLPMPFSPNIDLGVFSHEFFHCWNVERIRPKTLEPFNFEKSNMSDALWFAEGFTQYYGDLILHRNSLTTLDNFLFSMQGLINAKEVRPGAKRYSPIEASQNAVFVDAGVAIDKSNYDNTYSSYYPYGGAIALALDLSLRSTFNLSLDDYMLAVWNKFGKNEIAYSINDLQQTLAAVTKSDRFAEDFFKNYVYGHESFDYQKLLEAAGFVLKKQLAGKAWLGNVVFKKDAKLTIANNTIIGTPLYEAGLDIDDQIISIDGKELNTDSEYAELLTKYQPGNKVAIVFNHRGKVKSATITFSENPRLIISTFEKEGKKTSKEILAFRNAWLSSKIK